MTEQEWLSSTDPAAMLEFFQGKASDRKLRLFACACCRRIWDFLPTDACRTGVETAERYADGRATNQERCSAWSTAVDSAEKEGITAFDDYQQESIQWGTIPGGLAFMASIELLGGRKFNAARVALEAAMEIAWSASRLHNSEETARLDFEKDYSLERMAQTPILRDIIGNPFRLQTINPCWLAWNGGTVVKLAQAVCDERAFDRLPILADALEEAGCTDTDILNHCRQPGEHVRGCWVIDLLFGKS